VATLALWIYKLEAAVVLEGCLPRSHPEAVQPH
jgi:hypothetical protein